MDELTPTRATDVSISRFEMSYPLGPLDRLRKKHFISMRRHRAGAVVFAALTFTGAAILLLAHTPLAPLELHRWVVLTDADRAVDSRTAAVLLLLCAAGVYWQSRMRGVSIDRDWIEVREVFLPTIPRFRRWSWMQVTRIVIDTSRIDMELIDGRIERINEVFRFAELRDYIVAMAQRKRVPITFGP